MDNLTHSLVGWALAETGLKRRTRKGLAACVLAANMPDIDVFFGWAPWAPLAMHRGFTHGLIGGVLVMPPLLAGLLWLLDRWQVRRGVEFRSGLAMHFGWLLALCYLGALTHPLLDLQNVYAIQLLSPMSERWFHADGLFIVSPWLLAMLAAGIPLSRRRANRGMAHAGWPALAALAGVVAFISLNVGISAFAWNAPRMGAPYAKPDRVFAAPGPLRFWRRDIVWRQDGRIVHGRYDPLRSLTALVDFGPPVPDNMADPLVRRAAHANADVEKFLAWSQMPLARIARGRCSVTVTFGDARFGGPAMSRGFTRTVEMPSDVAGCPG
ncbi:metal-dependent hydrolase [Novosphingobium mangrovi (ex Huang et al. 2023)]|uniref:Metal-dependent hydrolase n=1 Tax=Novosphingobium mangrovi (ex Huang et al. 2023) TaxID=2976432 RepID=A0ABT2I783_9SPHN|nr:metal-dependent hydrolase [Novosphingobium mangrovi (ex Huang et al. 2023)]MCT2400681.1 metal-dependent hydrolase [Novosphingobium mangrovi (ex Huang et al. 2023)]